MPKATETDGQELMRLFIDEIKRRLKDEASELKAADFEMIRKLLADNSVTFASVQRGDFGAYAQAAAEEFPFEAPDEEPPTFLQ